MARKQKKSEKVPAVFVSITRYKGRKGINGKVLSAEDQSRGFWHIRNLKCANAAKLLVAVNDGVIDGIWDIDCSKQWQNGYAGAIKNRTTEPQDENKYFCVVKGDCMAKRHLIGKKLNDVVGFSMCGPLRYGLI